MHPLCQFMFSETPDYFVRDSEPGAIAAPSLQRLR